MKYTSSCEEYARICGVVLREKPYLDPEFMFRDLCWSERIDPEGMDELFREELGLGGQEVLEQFREGEVRKFLFLHH